MSATETHCLTKRANFVRALELLTDLSNFLLYTGKNSENVIIVVKLLPGCQAWLKKVY
jgi:hypothetical protein